MQQQALVAIYPTRALAEQAKERLIATGVPAADIRLSNENQGPSGAAATAHEPGFFEWLFGAEPTSADRDWYQTNLRDGRTAVSVYRRQSTAGSDRIRAILDEFGPLDVETQDTAEGAVTGGAATGDATAQGEQVIPVAKEELQLGKRQTETRHRIRTYVVEKPVEQQVTLVDERVVIERRPAQSAAGTGGEFQERDIELVERHEEPVVAKRTRADEEIRVSKTANERTETVRDTVRETKVDIDKAAAGDKPAARKE